MRCTTHAIRIASRIRFERCLPNARLHRAVCHWEEQLRQNFEQTGIKQRAIHEFRYVPEVYARSAGNLKN
jgi:hypothetical protein